MLSSQAVAGRDQYFGMNPDAFAELGATYLSANDIQRALAGRTEIWMTGDRAFYAKDGNLLLKTKVGQVVPGHWRVSGAGKMCTNFDGRQGYCHRYMRFKGQTYYIWTGKVWSIQVTKPGKAF